MGQTSSYYYSDYSNNQKETLPPPQDMYNRDDNTNSNTPTKKNALDESPVVVHKVNLLTLSNKELRIRLKDYSHVTKQDVRNAATALNLDEDELIASEEWYLKRPTAEVKQQIMIQTNKNNSESVGITTESAATATNHSHMDVALTILKMSPEIKALRFKLVPAKLSEWKFWSAVFYILEFYSPDDLGCMETTKLTSSPDGGSGKSVTSNGSKSATEKNTKVAGAKAKCASNSAVPNNASNQLQVQALLKQKDDELTTLRLQLAKTKNELFFLQEQQKQQSATYSDNNQINRRSHHPGKWLLTRESREFLSLEEEIKQKLRDGKQKRLQEVLDQMKFILDSDDLKDSNGEWDCCGQVVYDSSGCKSC